MRTAFSVLLALHALVHLVGFVGPFQLLEQVSFPSALLGGRLEAGALGAKLLGLLWLATAIGLGVAAVVASIQPDWWLPYTTVVIAFSLLLCIVGWPASKLGIPINVAILLGLMAVRHGLGWSHVVALFRVLS